MNNQILSCGRFNLNLNKTKIMGVLNCTPDSFSDGGKFLKASDALKQAEKMIKEGADILDIGAESTKPYSQAITVEEEIKRLSPVVKELVKNAQIPISIDTKNPPTMRAMLDLGVDMINDVKALRAEGAVEAVKNSNCAICLMHMRGEPENMQDNLDYADLFGEINQFLKARVKSCLDAGIAKNRLIIDAGFGFAKNPAQNLELVKKSADFLGGEYPLLLGVSKKSTIGAILGGKKVEERLIGSVVLAAFGAFFGAKILRVHNVAESLDALKIAEALMNY